MFVTEQHGMMEGGALVEKRKDVGPVIHAVSNLLSRRVDAEKRERGMAEVTPMQIWIIGYLHDHCDQDIFQKDIERAFTITRSTVTGILKLMEKNGYIMRITVPEDARLKKLVLTKKGEDILQKVREHRDEMERLLVNGMTEEEINALFQLLDKLKQNLRREC